MIAAFATQKLSNYKPLQLSEEMLRMRALIKDQPFLKSIIGTNTDKFIALGEKFANDASEGKEITWTCPDYLPLFAKEAIKIGC